MDHSQIFLPKLTPLNKLLIIISCSFYILEFALSKLSSFQLSGTLGLSASGFLAGHFYTLITYPFISNNLMVVILNSLMLWLMGSEFELNWGKKRYFHFLLSVVIGGGLLYLLVTSLFFSGTGVYTYPLIGLSGIVSSLCLAYAIIFPDRVFSIMMLIPIKAKYFCMILVVISLFQGLSGPTGVSAWGQLGGIIVAYLFMIVVSNRKIKNLSAKIGELTRGRSAKKSKARLTIVKDDNEDPPKYWQ